MKVKKIKETRDSELLDCISDYTSAETETNPEISAGKT
jgi:hypothetical protein